MHANARLTIHGHRIAVIENEFGEIAVDSDLVLTSDVPVGAGLSSSAALECAVLTALVDLNAIEITPIDRAMLARRAEN